jgi:hypothetical protein
MASSLQDEFIILRSGIEALYRETYLNAGDRVPPAEEMLNQLLAHVTAKRIVKGENGKLTRANADADGTLHPPSDFVLMYVPNTDSTKRKMAEQMWQEGLRPTAYVEGSPSVLAIQKDMDVLRARIEDLEQPRKIVSAAFEDWNGEMRTLILHEVKP